MRDKIAIVASGGGMSCSYAAGAMSALANFWRFTDPDFAITGSGSAGTFAYYISGQYQEITNVWGGLLSSKKFINKFRFWKLINIDYLVDEIFHKNNLLDTRAVAASGTEFLISAINYRTSDLTYFSNKDGKEPDDIFELLRASKAMPIAFNKKIGIDGEKYCDSYLSSDSKAHIRKAVELGAKNIIAINNRIHRRANERLFRLWLKHQSRFFQENYIRQVNELEDYKIPDNVNVIKIVPTSKLKISTFNSNKAQLAETIQMGHDDVVNSKELAELFGSLQ